MQFHRHTWILAVVVIGLPWCAGCDSERSPATQPSVTEPESALIVPDSHDWPRAEAAARLDDEGLSVSAAVRLVRLAEQRPLCVPPRLTDEHVRRLRLVNLDDQYWALGLADKQDPRRLRAPILLTADGDVKPLAFGVAEELLVLHVADDPDIFPHLVALPWKVALLADGLEPAMVLEPDQKVRFDLRRQRGFPYVALLLNHDGQTSEVARYTWDPYELAFLGPAIDSLPDPPGGKFRIDVRASARLEPLGGEVPETLPVKELPEDEELPDGPLPHEEWLS